MVVPGEGNGTPLQYSCLENPTDGGAWWATVHGVAHSRTRLSDSATAAAALVPVKLSSHAHSSSSSRLIQFSFIWRSMSSSPPMQPRATFEGGLCPQAEGRHEEGAASRGSETISLTLVPQTWPPPHTSPHRRQSAWLLQRRKQAKKP